MDDIVDQILKSYAQELDSESLEESREKISRYIETLSSAGKTDSRQLAHYGLAYLRQLREGPDPRYTGC